MEDRLRKALDEMTSLAQQSRQLSPSEQDALAARLEAMASSLRWEMLFHLPASETTDTLGGPALPGSRLDQPANAV